MFCLPDNEKIYTACYSGVQRGPALAQAFINLGYSSSESYPGGMYRLQNVDISLIPRAFFVLLCDTRDGIRPKRACESISAKLFERELEFTVFDNYTLSCILNKANIQINDDSYHNWD